MIIKAATVSSVQMLLTIWYDDILDVLSHFLVQPVFFECATSHRAGNLFFG